MEEVLGWEGCHFWSDYIKCCLSYCVYKPSTPLCIFYIADVCMYVQPGVDQICHLQYPDVHSTNQTLVEGVGACVGTLLIINHWNEVRAPFSPGSISLH